MSKKGQITTTTYMVAQFEPKYPNITYLITTQ